MSFHIKIGNYRLSKNLGIGSFGKVKMAFNEVSGHEVAVKIMNKKKIKQQGVFEKVKREIKVLRIFNHPHIIKHYEFIDTPSDIFMIIEYAENGELFDLISRKDRLEEFEARKLFQQIYSAIEYIHFHKISHRDLKPENLLLDKFNNIKLIDFGLSNSMKDAQSLRTACGSPNYAAPEVISGRTYGGVQVDIWSMGVILYAMVCGTLPFDDDSMSQLFIKIKEGRYHMPNHVSEDLKDLICRMLQPNPIRRITMQEIRDHPWYLQDLPRYLQNLSAQCAKPKKSIEVDQSIVDQLFQLNLNLQGKTVEQITQSIKEKRNTEYCGVYELLFHHKLKSQCFENIYESENTITQKDTENSLPSQRFNSLKQFFIHSKQHQSTLSNQAQPELILSRQQSVPQTYYSLSTSHNDRLARIMNKFKVGEEPQPQLLQQKSTQSSLSEQQCVSQSTAMDSVHSSSLTEAVINQGVPKTESTLILRNFLEETDEKVQTQKLFIEQQENLKQVKTSALWQAGLLFKGKCHEMVKAVCHTLKELDIEWQNIPKEQKLKCRTRIVDADLIDTEDEKVIQEYLKKDYLKFYINFYKQPLVLSQGTDDDSYMLDIQLFKGSILVFKDFAQYFMTLLKNKCNIHS